MRRILRFDARFGSFIVCPRHSFPSPLGALGGDGGGVVGIDDHPSEQEEVLGVRRDSFRPDGFHGPVFAGYGDRDPILWNHASRLRAKPDTGSLPLLPGEWARAGRNHLEHRRFCAVWALPGGVAGIVESDGFLAPSRTCDFGRLLLVAFHRVPPAGFEGGVFRGDGFGDEYGGGDHRSGSCDNREDGVGR